MTSIRLIVGLGNPGRNHDRDRHNVGFWFVDRLAQQLKVSLAREAKYDALTARVAGPAGDVWLMLPQTYMNLSGKAVGAIARFFKVTPEEILVVHDELDFAPGTVKMKLGGGVGGHNGLKDIAEKLGSQHFWRIRIGIGHPGDRDLVADYVLSKPSAADREQIDAIILRALEVIPTILSDDLTGAMQRLHTKPGSERPKPPRREPGAPTVGESNVKDS
jgi:peptidyl-tRNA hydrolase, PTH1 family